MIKPNLARSALLITAFSMTIHTQAAVTLDRTRIIFDGNQPSINITIRNDHPELPYLAQSWLENDRGEKISMGPIVATPPIQRMEPQKRSIVRISTMPNVNQLPQDQESVFYYNLREIPPQAEEPGVLQIALQSRVKLFYRPALLVEQNTQNWIKQITLTPIAGGYQINNPTGFYFTVIGLGGSKKQAETDHFEAIMISSKSSQQVKSVNLPTPYLTYINDFGGKPSISFQCQASQCTLVE